MALNLYHDKDCLRPVSDADPFISKHTNAGEPVVTKLYIGNDGKRKGVSTDTPGEIALIYTNLKVQLEGVQVKLEQALNSSTGDNTLMVESTEGLNIGVIMKGGLERLRVEEVLTSKSIRVTRNYTADGKASNIQNHTIGSILSCETSMVSLALPSPNEPDYNTEGVYVREGEPITTGVDPSVLQNEINAQATTLNTNNGSRYHANGLIKIDNEVMKITNVSNNTLTVIRGYNGTTRATHHAQAIIYCVGIVDRTPTSHPVFVRVQPPANLPTQKSRSVRLVLVSDEEIQ